MTRSLGVLAVSLFLVAGCTAVADNEIVSPDDPLAPYLTQGIEWAECGAGAECATVVAPLDWDNPGVGDDVQ